MSPLLMWSRIRLAASFASFVRSATCCLVTDITDHINEGIVSLSSEETNNIKTFQSAPEQVCLESFEKWQKGKTVFGTVISSFRRGKLLLVSISSLREARLVFCSILRVCRFLLPLSAMLVCCLGLPCFCHSEHEDV